MGEVSGGIRLRKLVEAILEESYAAAGRRDEVSAGLLNLLGGRGRVGGEVGGMLDAEEEGAGIVYILVVGGLVRQFPCYVSMLDCAILARYVGW